MSDAAAQSAPAPAPAPAPVPVEDKPQAERRVIATLVQGTVKWFNVRNGYGFINRNDTKEDVFVHQTAIKRNNPRKFLRSVGDGELVEFDVIEAAKGSEAANVTGPGGVPVKGSRYAPNRRRFRRRFFPRSPRPRDQFQPSDGPAPSGEAEGPGENEGRPQQQQQQQQQQLRRRKPRRALPEAQDGEPAQNEVEGDGQTPRLPRRRFWRSYRRPFPPRPSPDQTADGQQPAPGETPEQGKVNPAGIPQPPQTNGEVADGQKQQQQRRQPRRRRQRNSESSTSKNDTEKSASDPGTPPQTSKAGDLKSTSKAASTSPQESRSPEEEPANKTVPAAAAAE